MHLLLARGITQRQFAVTKKGFMALVPLGTEERDQICIFPGCRTPYILRRDSGGNGIQGGDQCYRLVGEAYVHGFYGRRGAGIWYEARICRSAIMYSKSTSLFVAIIVKRMGVRLLLRVGFLWFLCFPFYLNDNWPKDGIWGLIDVFTCFFFNVLFPSLIVSEISRAYTAFLYPQ
jgi:hypothetical protein